MSIDQATPLMGFMNSIGSTSISLVKSGCVICGDNFINIYIYIYMYIILPSYCIVLTGLLISVIGASLCCTIQIESILYCYAAILAIVR